MSNKTKDEKGMADLSSPEDLVKDAKVTTDQSGDQSGVGSGGHATVSADKMGADTPDNAERFQGRVKWFSEKRGYGFVEIGDEEVFIHRSTLNNFGISKLQNDDVITVSLINSERGRIVETLYGVERPPIPPELMSDTPEDGEMLAIVKFFNNHKGYGFIVTDHINEDIFIHFRIIEKNGFSSLEQGQKILVRLEDGERGKQVTTIRLYTGEDDLKGQPRI